MDLFEEISKTKSDFPKIKSIKKEFSGKKLNLYQLISVSKDIIFSIGLFVVFFFFGIIFGNLFSTCKASSYYFSDTCLVNEFNFSLMVVIWFIGLLVSIVIFSIGHIISLLTEISEKLSKNNL